MMEMFIVYIINFMKSMQLFWGIIDFYGISLSRFTKFMKLQYTLWNQEPCSKINSVPLQEVKAQSIRIKSKNSIIQGHNNYHVNYNYLWVKKKLKTSEWSLKIFLSTYITDLKHRLLK